MNGWNDGKIEGEGRETFALCDLLCIGSKRRLSISGEDVELFCSWAEVLDEFTE